MAISNLVTLLSVFAIEPCTAQIDPEHAHNITTYHLNPAIAGAVPVNMDTGDVFGDLYFYLGQFLLPLECTNQTKQGRAHFDCDNPERTDRNLVVTKVDMQIDSRSTAYSACNICNGTDPFSNRPCEKGTYVCDCEDKYLNRSAHCDPTRIGKSSIRDHFAPHQSTAQCRAALQNHCGRWQSSMVKCGLCALFYRRKLAAASCVKSDLESFCPTPWGGCTPTSPEWMCWAQNIPRKTGGFWYSTLKGGLCNETSPTGSCGWKVLSTRTVKEACIRGKLVTHVEAASPSCFGNCGPRNMTSPCWIGCFFDALLGKQARHSVQLPLSGLPASEIAKTWSDAFLPTEQGGCAVVEIPDFAPGTLEALVV